MELGAALLFVEHRFYGKSLPYGPEEYLSHLQFLTAEQVGRDGTRGPDRTGRESGKKEG